MFGPPTSRLHRQPVFAASADCVSIADRRIVCVICTQQHSCCRTMDAWWFQWLRWLPVCVCVCEGRMGAVCCEWVCSCEEESDFCLRAVWSRSSFFLVCSTLIIKALSAVKWGHGCVRVRTAPPFLTGNFPSCDGIHQEFTWSIDSLNMTSSLDWWRWWWFPETPFSDCLVCGFLPSVSIAAGLNVLACSCGPHHVIRSHAILDFNGVTLWFCVVSMCSLLPLASS